MTQQIQLFKTKGKFVYKLEKKNESYYKRTKIKLACVVAFEGILEDKFDVQSNENNDKN